MRNVLAPARQEIVDADDLGAFIQKTVAQVTADEPSGPGQQDAHALALQLGHRDAILLVPLHIDENA